METKLIYFNKMLNFLQYSPLYRGGPGLIRKYFSNQPSIDKTFLSFPVLKLSIKLTKNHGLLTMSSVRRRGNEENLRENENMFLIN